MATVQCCGLGRLPDRRINGAVEHRRYAGRTTPVVTRRVLPTQLDHNSAWNWSAGTLRSLFHCSGARCDATVAVLSQLVVPGDGPRHRSHAPCTRQLCAQALAWYEYAGVDHFWYVKMDATERSGCMWSHGTLRGSVPSRRLAQLGPELLRVPSAGRYGIHKTF